LVPYPEARVFSRCSFGLRTRLKAEHNAYGLLQPTRPATFENQGFLHLGGENAAGYLPVAGDFTQSETGILIVEL
jgi:hypothetical protein